MADSVIEAVTKNIVSTLDGVEITYGDRTETLTCDRERLDEVYGNRYPIVIVANPIVNNVGDRQRTMEMDAHYTLRFMHNGVNDEYDPDTAVKSVSEVFANVSAEIHKLMLADHDRGGNAFTTFWQGMVDYMDSPDEHSTLYCIDMEYVVKIITDYNDLYVKGGL